MTGTLLRKLGSHRMINSYMRGAHVSISIKWSRQLTHIVNYKFEAAVEIPS